MLTAALPISVALLATTTIRLLFLLPGLMLFAALLSALALAALPTLLATLVLLALVVLASAGSLRPGRQHARQRRAVGRRVVVDMPTRSGAANSRIDVTRLSR
jgi:membrane protein implicated in regulation of membrane protease activity